MGGAGSRGGWSRVRVSETARDQDSCVMVIHNQVYDLSSWLDIHPGGRHVLWALRGQDASKEFEAAFHSQHAIDKMEQFRVGDLIPKDFSIHPRHERILILYASQTGSARRLAIRMQMKLAALTVLPADVKAMEEFDPEDLAHETLVMVLVSTYTGGEVVPKCKFFVDWLVEAADDFRVGSGFLKHVSCAVYGVGNSAYAEQFNAAGKHVYDVLARHGSGFIAPLGLGDSFYDMDAHFDEWMSSAFRALPRILASPGLTSSSSGSDQKQEDFGNEEGDSGLVDLEELGDVMSKQKLLKSSSKGIVPEMVTPTVRKSLTKQGYKIIGSHSGVKLCRWTKAMLRGRGGCYKHTFYGIKSYQCMEMTPSLACANKCVFCWRHHSNPVGREWRWQIDDARTVLEGGISGHKSMIKQMKGVPGVKPERLEEAFNIRHCALSLVGEPIMYPHINEFLDLLHGKQISSFLVTNAQFPECIRKLKPVTQLYVSVDASTKESLKEVDRPLFADFWERYLDSLQALSKKNQRTVFRLTLVKSYNMDDLRSYVKLIRMGRPQFIEVKGVTFCGSSDASDLTMKNVPFHEEVRSFCQDLCAELGEDYALACEHAHSCCVLIAHKMFLIEGKWHTWINYERFHDLVQSGEEFGSLDYLAPTPEWALFGDERAGFDPEETRFYRKNKH